MKTFNLAILSGDGIGPEIMAEAQAILEYLKQAGLVNFKSRKRWLGGQVYVTRGLLLQMRHWTWLKPRMQSYLGLLGIILLITCRNQSDQKWQF